MESSFLTTIFLPLALFVIMLGMGLGVTVADFKRILIQPKAVLLGLIAQLILLPAVGFLLVAIVPLPPELAVGVMILSACPGGVTSNLITYLAGGNVALSITLTAISSIITVFSIPLVVNFAMQYFMGAEALIQLPFWPTVTQIAAITLVPVALGMLLKHYAPHPADNLEQPVKWLSLGFLGLIIFAVVFQEQSNIATFFLQIGWVMLSLNLLTMLLGFTLSILARLDQPSAKAITVEVGIQNGTLAIAIASVPTFLNSPTMAVPAAIYSLIMFATGGAFAWWVQRRQNISIS